MFKKRVPKEYASEKNVFCLETVIFLVILVLLFGLIGMKMGGVNMVNTLMNTAYDLLLNTVLYIAAIAVIAGALSGLLTEFGVVAAINKLLSPLMKPLYGLPGAGVVGIITTYLSDNPAILTLADDDNFKKYFRKYQLPALTNIGTSFGMGLIVSAFIMGLKSPSGENFFLSVLIGNFGAVLGSIVSTRLMLLKTKKEFGTEAYSLGSNNNAGNFNINKRTIRKGSTGQRAMAAALEGGKSGVEIGIAIVPGVLIICTLVLMITNGPGQDGIYTGAAGEGVAFLPWITEKIDFILSPLFGFSSAEAISIPITALGSAGAAIGLIPSLVDGGLVSGNDIAVFTSMCMCWSGYLSTHVAMMDSLNFRELTGHAIFSHTIGGLTAGIGAHFMYMVFSIL